MPNEVLHSNLEHKKIVRVNGQKVIKNIIPFNNIFYKSCFYNALFTSLQHFNKSILQFLSAEVYKYEWNQQNNDQMGFQLTYIADQNDIDKLFEQRVYTYGIRNNENIVFDVISAIDENRPVILGIDCFYESIRKDTYQKIHWPHNIVVFGYNCEMQIFHVIEHSHIDSLEYKEQFIPFEDIISGHKSFESSFKKQLKKSDYIQLFAYPFVFPDHHFDLLLKQYTNMYKKYEGEIRKGYNTVSLFSEQMIDLIDNKKMALQHLFEIKEHFKNVLYAKRAERYFLSNTVSEGSKIIDKLDIIIQTLELPYRLLEKMNFKKMIDESKFIKITKLFKDLECLEHEYFDLILNI